MGFDLSRRSPGDRQRTEAARPSAGTARVPEGPDLRAPRGDAERIPDHDGRRGVHEAGSLPPLPIRPLPEPPAGEGVLARLSRRLRRNFG
jgi:hypothetical protein